MTGIRRMSIIIEARVITLIEVILQITLSRGTVQISGMQGFLTKKRNLDIQGIVWGEEAELWTIPGVSLEMIPEDVRGQDHFLAPDHVPKQRTTSPNGTGRKNLDGRLGGESQGSFYDNFLIRYGLLLYHYNFVLSYNWRLYRKLFLYELCIMLRWRRVKK